MLDGNAEPDNLVGLLLARLLLWRPHTLRCPSV